MGKGLGLHGRVLLELECQRSAKERQTLVVTRDAGEQANQ